MKLESKPNVRTIVPEALFEMKEPSAEFYLEHKGVEYIVYPAGWQESQCDIFEIVKARDESFVDAIAVSPLEDVSEAFARWCATQI